MTPTNVDTKAEAAAQLPKTTRSPWVLQTQEEARRGKINQSATNGPKRAQKNSF
jgi:hypothetical protein